MPRHRQLRDRRIMGLQVTALVLTMLISGVQETLAAALTSVSDTMSSSKVSTTSTHALRFTTPTGASDSSDTVIINFPSDFDFTGKTIGTVAFTHGASTGAETTETLAASPSASAWGAVFSGTQNRILTLTAPTDGTGAASLAASDKVIISYTGTSSTNPSSASSYPIGIAGTFGDAGTSTVNILNDDQVAVTATVAQSLTFSLSDNTIEFGTLSASAAQYADDSAGSSSEAEAHNIVIGTNASNGYTLTLSGSTLTSGSNTITAIGSSNTASSAGSEQFGMRMTATGGSGAVVAPYAASGFAFDTAAFPDQVASASGASANTTYSVRYLANITATTEAGSYSTALTYTATANY